MPVSVFDMQSLQHLWCTDEVRAIFGEENRVQKWLDVEAALASAQADMGIIPRDAAARSPTRPGSGISTSAGCPPISGA